jgi:hypothetical protein
VAREGILVLFIRDPVSLGLRFVVVVDGKDSREQREKGNEFHYVDTVAWSLN